MERQHFVPLNQKNNTGGKTLSETRLEQEGGVLTDLLVMLLGFKTDNLQDARAGDVRHHIWYTLPHTQQSATQHVVLTEAHSLQTLLAFLNFLTLPIPKGQKRTNQILSLCTNGNSRLWIGSILEFWTQFTGDKGTWVTRRFFLCD